MNENNFNCKILYKYRSLQNFKRFMDILVNNRLYACKYNEMNDYMEGHYLYSWGDITKDIIQDLKNQKERLRICSLTEDKKNDVMLAHYADGGKGVILGVRVVSRGLDIRKIKYKGLPEIKQIELHSTNEKAKEILSYKTESWEYEKEFRIFTTKRYVKVNIKEIIYGPRIKREDRDLIERLVEKLQLKINCKGWGEI